AGLASLQSLAEELAPLPLKLPIPAFMGTPTDIEIDPNLREKPSDKPRPPFYAPKGVQNVAFQKKVTSSDKSPITGTLDLITDGDKESTDSSFVELHRKTQWVQIDLEKPYKIYAILIWHAHNTFQYYQDVIVQVSNDPDFTQDVKTLFNNDQDNSSGLGVGTDKEYLETYEGKLIDAKGVVARYVRCYSRGSTYSALNRYTEIEVWALPAE
ncbi:MAG: discoidin domain-containing protein, partial [Verrucomicrobiae bacterium]|nr:discoidin domain-containing protein [Verrucomicrobiae bacterium]